MRKATLERRGFERPYLFDTKGNIEDYDHSYAFVKVEGVNMPIKVRGLQYLNRAYDMDEVYIKLCNWI